MLRRLVNPQVTVPANMDFLGELRDFITRIGRLHGYPNKVINAFRLAVDEAATNIIRHAYRNRDGFITVKATIKEDSLTVSFIDQGIHFNPNAAPDPDLNHYVDIGKKGGLGIFIIRKLMDEIDYRRGEEGNELTITKYCNRSYRRNFLYTLWNLSNSFKPKYLFRSIAL